MYVYKLLARNEFAAILNNTENKSLEIHLVEFAFW
jgi:hypothetical protein